MNEYHFPLTAGGIGDKFMILSMILNHRNEFDTDSVLNLYTESTSEHKLDLAFHNNEWLVKFNHDPFSNMKTLYELTDFFQFKHPTFDIPTKIINEHRDLQEIFHLNFNNGGYTESHKSFLNGEYWPVTHKKIETDRFCWILYTDEGTISEKFVNQENYDKFINKTHNLNHVRLEDADYAKNVQILSESKFIFASEGMWTHLSRAMNIPTIAYTQNKADSDRINQQGHFSSVNFEECLELMSDIS